MTLDQLFAQFLKEKEFLEGCLPKTITFFKSSYKAYKRFAPHQELPKKADLIEFVVAMRAALKPVSCNAYIKGINSFLKWLRENDYLTDQYKIPLMKVEQKKLPAYTEEELGKIYAYKAANFTQQRLHCLLCLLMDTGIRVQEGLSLQREKANLESLYITVTGKGDKERVIPISPEMRKILYRWLQKHDYEDVFCTREGKSLWATNIWRDASRLMKKIGVDPKPRLLHAHRHTFARGYLKHGGNLIYLQAVLGHSRLETTKIYIETELEDLQETHLKTSALSRLKKR